MRWTRLLGTSAHHITRHEVECMDGQAAGGGGGHACMGRTGWLLKYAREMVQTMSKLPYRLCYPRGSLGHMHVGGQQRWR